MKNLIVALAGVLIGGATVYLWPQPSPMQRLVSFSAMHPECSTPQAQGTPACVEAMYLNMLASAQKMTPAMAKEAVCENYKRRMGGEMAQARKTGRVFFSSSWDVDEACGLRP